MTTCQNCKHWDRKTYEDSGYYLGTGRCNYALEFWEATTWDDDGNNCFTDEAKNRRAFVNDGSSYSASLLTKPDFGCVDFEEKP